MANTYTSLHYHLVFSTKNRERLISQAIEQRVWEYLGGIARQNDMKALQIGGIEDHIHLVIGIPASVAVSKALQLLKGGSSKWIHEEFPEMAKFQWQDGYGAFSVSKSQVPDVVQYVANQREHHKVLSFQDEYRALLQRHGIEFDERYVWGQLRRRYATREHERGFGVRALKTPGYRQMTATRSVGISDDMNLWWLGEETATGTPGSLHRNGES